MSNTKNQIQNPDITLKFLTLGDSMVGKTSIVLRFVDNVFYEQTKSTIGVDFKTKTINFGNKKIKIKVWDTAGQERFRTITKQYYKNAEGIILIYDVTESKTFDQIEDWVMNIMDNKQSDAKVILVGNKIDCEERLILKEQGAELAKRFDLPPETMDCLLRYVAYPKLEKRREETKELDAVWPAWKKEIDFSYSFLL